MVKLNADYLYLIKIIYMYFKDLTYKLKVFKI